MMFKKLLVLFILVQNCYGKDIKPSFIFKSKGFVNDFIIDRSKIYVANDEGSVEIFDLATQKLIGEIFIEQSTLPNRHGKIQKYLALIDTMEKL